MEDAARAEDGGIVPIEDIDEAAYWPSRIPSTDDERIGTYCSSMMGVALEERRRLAAALTKQARSALVAYSMRMAMLGARVKSEQALRSGIAALAIAFEDPDADIRELLMSLAPLYRSAHRIGDAPQLFRSSAEYATNARVREAIAGFPDREAEALRLEAMGWHEMEGPAGVVYHFGSQPIPEGHLR